MQQKHSVATDGLKGNEANVVTLWILDTVINTLFRVVKGCVMVDVTVR